MTVPDAAHCEQCGLRYGVDADGDPVEDYCDDCGGDVVAFEGASDG